MKKNTYQRKRKKYFFKINLLFPLLLSFSCLFLCIGYANINNINLNIDGMASASAQKGVFISNAKVINNEEETSIGQVVNYYSTMLNTDIILSQEQDSTISFDVSLYNNSNIVYIYDGITPNEYDEDFYPNKYITYETDNRLQQGDKIESYQTYTFTITFKYVEDLNFNDLPEDFSNTINSYINFNFIMLQHVDIGDNIIDSSTNVIDSYIGESGSIVEYSGWTSSDYIYIGDYKKVIIIGSNDSLIGKWNALYDEEYNFIKRLTIDKTKATNSELGDLYLGIYILNVEANIKYLRISAPTSNFNNIKIYPILNDDFNGILDYNLIDFQMLFGDNIYDINNNVLSSYINASGTQISYNGWQSSEYIDISNYKKIAIASPTTTFLSNWNAFYNENKSFLKRLDCSAYEKKYSPDIGYYILVDVTDSYHYLRISEANSIMNNIKIYPIIENNYENAQSQNLIVGENIYKMENNVTNSYIGTNGTELSYSGWSSSEYIYIGDYDNWIIVGGYNFLTNWNAYYDENKSFVSILDCSNTKMYNKLLGYQGGSICAFKREYNIKYLRISEINSAMNNIRVYPIINDDFNGVLSFNIN